MHRIETDKDKEYEIIYKCPHLNSVDVYRGAIYIDCDYQIPPEIIRNDITGLQISTEHRCGLIESEYDFVHPSILHKQYSYRRFPTHVCIKYKEKGVECTCEG